MSDSRIIEPGEERCPECGGYGLRGCGAAWHDDKPDTHCSPACQCRDDSRVWPIRWQEQFDRAERLEDRIAILQQIAALALDGMTPADGYWYAPDENGDPHYRNDAVTREQRDELDAIRQANGVGE